MAGKSHDGEEVDGTTLQQAETLREFARTHKASDLPWTLPEALVPPFGNRVVRILEEEDPEKSEKLKKLFAGLGTSFGPSPAKLAWVSSPPPKIHDSVVGKGTARSSRSDFTPLYLYIAFVMVGWALIYVFEPPRLVYTLMVLCCIQFGIATVMKLRSRKSKAGS